MLCTLLFIRQAIMAQDFENYAQLFGILFFEYISFRKWWGNILSNLRLLTEVEHMFVL